MGLNKFIDNLVKHELTFNFGHYRGQYCIHIIIGNMEHLVRLNDYNKMKQLWDEIEVYWL